MKIKQYVRLWSIKYIMPGNVTDPSIEDLIMMLQGRLLELENMKADGVELFQIGEGSPRVDNALYAVFTTDNPLVANKYDLTEPEELGEEDEDEFKEDWEFDKETGELVKIVWTKNR